jgi:uncharacterized protein with PIN domain
VKTASLRFYEELNEFLPPDKQKVPFKTSFRGEETVKSLVESQGVPHTEIDLVLVNGQSVPFDRKVHDGDHLSVFPVFESFDISGIQALHLHPLRVARFVADVHLGKLARYLRMLGLDTLYDNYYNDIDLIRISAEETRTILTRDRRLLMRREVERGYWIRSHSPPEQAREVVRRLQLEGTVRLFSRCTRCNGLLTPREEESVLPTFPGYKFAPGTRFYQCENCRHVYWNGSHTERFVRMMER